MEKNKNQSLMEKMFHLSEHRTDVKTEVIAGITTFMTMAYILAVNPNILSVAGMDRGAVFTATALASLLATLLMAAFANYPFVLAPGMGLKCVFCLHRRPADGIFLGGGTGSRICGGNHFYHPFLDECAGSDF